MTSLFRNRRSAESTAPAGARHPQLDPSDAPIVSAVQPYTLTPPARVAALLRAVEYVEARQLPGAYTECGVWRGGSVLAILLKLVQLDVFDRDVYLYDTFQGMPRPSEHDFSAYDGAALAEWEAAQREERAPWSDLFPPDSFSVDAARQVCAESGYPGERLHFVEGKVEDTIPEYAPDRIALLRLDTDWYESTRHELEHLYPRLIPGGVLIVDDYGHWDGCRRAVDEYFSAPGITPVLLTPVDYTCRLAVKA